jgi:hypothetical protein
VLGGGGEGGRGGRGEEEGGGGDAGRGGRGARACVRARVRACVHAPFDLSPIA